MGDSRTAQDRPSGLSLADSPFHRQRTPSFVTCRRRSGETALRRGCHPYDFPTSSSDTRASDARYDAFS